MLWRTILLEKDKVLGRKVFWINLIILAAVIIFINVAEYLIALSLPSMSLYHLIPLAMLVLLLTH